MSYGRLMHSVLALLRTQPVLRRASLGGALSFAVFTAFWTVLSFLLMERFHQGASAAGMFGVVGLIGAPGAPWAGRSSDRKGAGFAIALSLLLVALAFVLMDIRSGFPIITGIGREVCDTCDYFVIIYGVGWKPSRVFVCNQPRFARSREELSWADFRATWAPCGHGLICWGKRFRV